MYDITLETKKELIFVLITICLFFKTIVLTMRRRGNVSSERFIIYEI
jgi:hypothetical protein